MRGTLVDRYRLAPARRAAIERLANAFAGDQTSQFSPISDGKNSHRAPLGTLSSAGSEEKIGYLCHYPRWGRRSLGSISATATAYGREHGITVIEGGCPLMFDPTADVGHKVMRVVFAGHVPKTV